MKKKLLIYGWLLSPILLCAYHYGPGQAHLARHEAAQHLARATALEEKEDWAAARESYAAALAKMPATDKESRWQLRLAESKARMYAGELPEAMMDMETLLAGMQKENAPHAQMDAVRANLATAGYYAGWLMRLEGAPTEEWTLEVENARQHFRLLAEQHLDAQPGGAKPYQENLEATIRLARMDLSELEGLPLPSFCQGCNNVSQKCRSQRASQCKKPGEKQPKDARGAGAGQRPPGGS